MKRQLFLIGMVIVLGTMILSSCGNANTNNTDLQEPSASELKENAEEDEVGEKENNSMDVKAKTTEDLQAAFKGETTASAKYSEYSKKAEKEGYREIALLFKAASIAENIHANNHKSVLEESGAKVPVITPEFTIKTTKENLEDAINGETYEATTMYPGFLKDANLSGNQLALISLNYAFETEKKHKIMYENALASLGNNNVKSLSGIYFVCPTCGNTYYKMPPKRCGISMTDSERFVKINSL